METFYKIFQWPIRLLDWAGTRTVRLFGLHPSGEHASIYTADELRQLIDISHTSGHLEADEKKLINRVFDFADTEVREAMIPRTAVSALSLASTLEEAKLAFRTAGYSRMPVYRERLDDVVGIIFRRDLEAYLENPNLPFNLKELVRPPMFIPDTARLGAVLKRMKSTRTHLACVVDEHGGIEGIITLEDLLEEIVGEINDEFDEEVRSQIQQEGDSYVLDGMLAVRDANRVLNLDLPVSDGYTTVAGFLLAQAGRLLAAGESIEHNGVRFTVDRVIRRRIRRIRLVRLSAQASGTAITAFSS
jgi:CBS domain containing-hemolysin-like protein